jgi:hypothetical protein
MKMVVYLTAAAEDRYRREEHHAKIVGAIYSDYDAESRLLERAMRRLMPYKTVWLKKPAKQEEPQ